LAGPGAFTGAPKEPAMSTPTLVLVDVQNEYVTPGRPFRLAGIGPSLDNVRRLLARAREAGWRVVHVQHLQPGAVFAPGTEHGAFIPGFEPAEGEAHVVKGKLSSYSEDAYRALIDAADGEVLIAGYGSTMCCLATVVSGALFGHRYSFVHDASWARSPDGIMPESEVHRFATATLAIHAQLTTTEVALALAPSAQAAA
jgi:nicotinamidase-related amidase